MKALLWVLGIVAAGVAGLWLIFKVTGQGAALSNTAAIASNTPQTPAAAAAAAAGGSQLGSTLAGVASIVGSLGGAAKDIGVDVNGWFN